MTTQHYLVITICLFLDNYEDEGLAEEKDGKKCLIFSAHLGAGGRVEHRPGLVRELWN